MKNQVKAWTVAYPWKNSICRKTSFGNSKDKRNDPSRKKVCFHFLPLIDFWFPLWKSLFHSGGMNFKDHSQTSGSWRLASLRLRNSQIFFVSDCELKSILLSLFYCSLRDSKIHKESQDWRWVFSGEKNLKKKFELDECSGFRGKFPL